MISSMSLCNLILIFRELGVTLCVGNELDYQDRLHAYAAVGGTRAHMGMHVPTADVT
jgi:hypothetical protein